MKTRLRKSIRHPESGDYKRAVEILEQQQADVGGVYDTIETGANRRIPRYFKGRLAMLARELIDHETERDRYLERCRSLAYGAHAAIMLSDEAYDSLGFLDQPFAINIHYHYDDEEGANLQLSIAESAQEKLSKLGEVGEAWIKARAEEASIPESEQFWYTVGASYAVDYIYSMANALRGMGRHHI